MDRKIPKEKRNAIIILSLLWLFVILIYTHFSLLSRESHLSGIPLFYAAWKDLFYHPFAIFPIPSDILRGIGVLTIFYVVLLSLFYMTGTLRRGYKDQSKALGDGQFLDNLDDYNRRFTEPFGDASHDGLNNIILSQDIYLSLDNQKTRRNLNVMAIGGSGAGKSYNLVGPNLMQANTSYVVTDPSGGLYKEYGTFLESRGYNVKCFNLDHMYSGNHYNPFNYIHNDKDVEILVNTLIANTTPKEKQGGDPFWEKSEIALLCAIIGYIFHYSSVEQRHFSNVMKLLRMAQVSEDGRNDSSPLDVLFQSDAVDKDSFCAKQYQTFKLGAGKTMKSILISCAVRLQAFDLEDVANLTHKDDIDLDSVGDEKTALFIILPTGDTTFNFLASMMYSQLFQRLYSYCENEAEHSVLLVDCDDQVIRTFRAAGEYEAKTKKVQAEALLAKIRNSKETTIKYVEKYDWYEIRTKDDELITWRKEKNAAVEALAKIQLGRVKLNSEQSNHGQRLPIHTRLILDEFANIGKIPNFPEKVATIRKYDLSVMIILQSLTQLRKMYQDEWGELSGNCDNTIYLGGGADSDTTEWVSKLLGKETRTIINTSFGKGGGSTSLNKQGVELLSASQLRTIPEDECIVIPKSLYAFKGKKYMSDSHPNRAYVKAQSPYIFNPNKAEDLLYALHKDNLDNMHGGKKDEAEELEKREKDQDAANKKREADAKAHQNNEEPGTDGEPKMQPPGNLDPNSAVNTRCHVDQDDAKQRMIITTEMAWGDTENFADCLAYSEAPASGLADD